MRQSLILADNPLANELAQIHHGKNDNGNNGRTDRCSSSTEADRWEVWNQMTIGFNSMLSKQRTIAGERWVTTLLFDHRIETLHNHLDIREVNDLTPDYWVRGSTALLDATAGH